MTDTYSTTGYGATREHRRTVSAEALLKRYMDNADNPHDWEERNRIKNEITDYLRSKEGEAYIETVIEGWFQNAYRRMLFDYARGDGSLPDRKKRQKEIEEKQGEIEKDIEKVIDRRAKLKLLDLIMPNGKMLRNCTGKECKQLSTKTSTWLAKIATKVKPTELVGAVLSEVQVHNLWSSTRGK